MKRMPNSFSGILQPGGYSLIAISTADVDANMGSDPAFPLRPHSSQVGSFAINLGVGTLAETSVPDVVPTGALLGLSVIGLACFSRRKRPNRNIAHAERNVFNNSRVALFAFTLLCGTDSVQGLTVSFYDGGQLAATQADGSLESVTALPNSPKEFIHHSKGMSISLVGAISLQDVSKNTDRIVAVGLDGEIATAEIPTGAEAPQLKGAFLAGGRHELQVARSGGGALEIQYSSGFGRWFTFGVLSSAEPLLTILDTNTPRASKHFDRAIER